MCLARQLWLGLEFGYDSNSGVWHSEGANRLALISDSDMFTTGCVLDAWKSDHSRRSRKSFKMEK